MGIWDRKQRKCIHIWRSEKKTWVTMLPFAKNWLAESWRVDRGGSSQAFPPGSKPADTGISHDFTRRWSTTMRQASISRFWIAQEGHVFCAGSNHKRETEVNKHWTSVLKGRNQFSSEVWRMVGLINCGYAEVGSSFQDNYFGHPKLRTLYKKQTLSNSSKGPKVLHTYITYILYTSILLLFA